MIISFVRIAVVIVVAVPRRRARARREAGAQKTGGGWEGRLSYVFACVSPGV